MVKPKVIVILGPTASGKTALSLLLAKRFKGEIISADSRQIYRRMDIGTAKATKLEQQSIPHHLVDIKNPDEDYSVIGFKQDTSTAIYDITRRHKLPIVVGGTAQYIYALVDNWTIPAVKEDRALRARLKKDIAEQGLEKIYERLLKLDPEAAHVVDSKNPRRVIRALEVAMLSGQPFTAQRQRGELLFDCLLLGIKLNPEELAKRIEKRVRGMIAAGLVEEIENLMQKYPVNLKIFDTIGYREIVTHLQGKITLEQAVQNIITNTKHFTRRQLQWFKRDKRIHWVQNYSTAEKLVADFIK